jgi:hypothetical protein
MTISKKLLLTLIFGLLAQGYVHAGLSEAELITQLTNIVRKTEEIQQRMQRQPVSPMSPNILYVIGAATILTVLCNINIPTYPPASPH